MTPIFAKDDIVYLIKKYDTQFKADDDLKTVLEELKDKYDIE